MDAKISLLLMLLSVCSAHESQDDMPAMNSSLNAEDEFEMKAKPAPELKSGVEEENKSRTANAYHFAYTTADESGPKMFREERKLKDGLVTGKYGYVDPNGHLRVVNYEAGENGFTATGDTGPDEEAMKEMRRMHEFHEQQRRPVMDHWNKVAHTLQLAGDHSNQWSSAVNGQKISEKFQRQRYVQYPNGYTSTRTFPRDYGFEHAAGNAWENALKNIQRTSALAQNHQQTAWNYQRSLLAGQQPQPMFGRPAELPGTNSAWASSWSSNYPNQKTNFRHDGNNAHQTPYFNGRKIYPPAPTTPTWTAQHNYNQQHWPSKTYPSQYPSYQPPSGQPSWAKQPNYNTNFYTPAQRFPTANVWPSQPQPTWPFTGFDQQQRMQSDRYQYRRNLKPTETAAVTARKTKRQPSSSYGETRVSVTHGGPGGFSYSYAY